MKFYLSGESLRKNINFVADTEDYQRSERISLELVNGYRLEYASESKIKELIAAKNTLKAKENEVLNYFVNYATNAAAESLNSKMKGFRSELRGIRDLPFFMYRCCMIFG